MNTKIDTVIIENVTPSLDGGRYAVKRVVHDLFTVEADIYSHGHNVLQAVLLYKKEQDVHWKEAPMTCLENHRWCGTFQLTEVTVYEYTVIGWRDPFLSWSQELAKKHEAGVDITSELLEGKELLEVAMGKATKQDATNLKEILLFFEKQLSSVTTTEKILDFIGIIEKKLEKKESISEFLDKIKNLLEGEMLERKSLSDFSDPVSEIFLGQHLASIMSKYADRSDCGKFDKILKVRVNRKEAEYASWYEMWPRSQGTIDDESATFGDMIKRLPEIKKMGFHVIYLPPIHPIGYTNRKGPNNSLICPPGSPGCPYAIGNKDGGHTAIEPGLGTIDDFSRFEKACRDMDMEVALDLALQTSPDHPWVKEHPEWFYKRPDGTIKYAENPPKKYEDIYPLNFNTTDAAGLWNAIYDIMKFWMDKGVRIFRIDNPHTKPVRFWEWLFAKIQSTDPDILFLSEAFTHPKMMKMLAKIGFTQSYTYFTWRNFKHELTDYFMELTQTDTAEYLRGNLFTNTPDILPTVLQNAPRSAFKMRATLAATLSSLWGIYNGFELCEGKPVPGKEEYLNSEKYDYKVWDWDRAGNIKNYIIKLNQIRETQPALKKYTNLEFYKADNDNIIFYGKHTEDFSNVILVIVNLDPYQKQECMVHLPIDKFGIKADENYQVYDLISEKTFYWNGSSNFVSLDPDKQSAHVFRLLKWSHHEQNFDYFY